MKCAECPFHLVCFMGRLGGKEADERSLCPICGKLELLGDKDEEDKFEQIVRVYKFHCELRVATPEVRRSYKEHQLRSRSASVRSGSHSIPSFIDKDPVDDRRLKVAECLECCKSPIRSLAHVRIVDLDADWEDEERRKRHVFRLRAARED